MSQINCLIDHTGFVDFRAGNLLRRLRCGGAEVSLDSFQIGGTAEYQANVNLVALLPDGGDQTAAINLDVPRIGLRKAAGFGRRRDSAGGDRCENAGDWSVPRRRVTEDRNRSVVTILVVQIDSTKFTANSQSRIGGPESRKYQFKTRVEFLSC